MRAPGDFVFTALDCFSPPTRIIVEYHPMMPRYKYKEVVIPADWYDSSISIQFRWAGQGNILKKAIFATVFAHAVRTHVKSACP